jgi:type I restriction enzyme M protein
MTNEELKKTLWDAANKLRGSVSAAEYKYPVLGLVFLKYVSDLFDAHAEVIRQRLADSASDIYIEDDATRKVAEASFVTDKTFYDQDNVFWVPPGSHFGALLKQGTDPELPQLLDAAMGDIEAENPSLKGVLYREFSRLALGPGKLNDLMIVIARLKFDPQQHGSRDVFGEVYEYLLGQFALNEGAKAGEFYTPKSVVNLLVEILAPFKGKIYDPACGSGGMFVQSARFKDAHQKTLGKKGDLAVYGQELMAQTRRLCLMNLAVHGLDGDIGQTYGSTFTNDQHKTLRAPPRQNSCRLQRTTQAAAMKDGLGSIRTGIQRQGGSEVAAAGERSAGGGGARGWHWSGNPGALARGCAVQARPRAGLDCRRPA